jgi:hypothetical protein
MREIVVDLSWLVGVLAASVIAYWALGAVLVAVFG